VNADLNGAANILRKVASNLGIDLSRLSRRSLTTVARIRLWVLPKAVLSAESSVSLELRVSISTMLSFPHARSAPLPPGSRTYNRYIDQESFLATPAGHTVDAWSWVKSKDSP
jgi:hypothetical protein